MSELPEAAYYVLDEMLPLLPKDPYMKTKISLIKLRCFLLAHLQAGTDRLISESQGGRFRSAQYSATEVERSVPASIERSILYSLFLITLWLLTHSY